MQKKIYDSLFCNRILLQKMIGKVNQLPQEEKMEEYLEETEISTSSIISGLEEQIESLMQIQTTILPSTESTASEEDDLFARLDS